MRSVVRCRRSSRSAWTPKSTAARWTPSAGDAATERRRMRMPVHDLIVDLIVRYGFQVVGAILSRWIGRLAQSRLERQDMEPPMRQLITNALRLVVMLFALVVALDKFGFQIAPLVAGIGVAGLGLGIALQGVLSNLVAGLSIIFTKPFRV